MSFIDSIKYLHNLLGVEFKSKDFKPKEKHIINPLWVFERLIGNSQYYNCNEIQYLNESLLNDYIPILYIDWLKEGIMPWSAKKFNIAYSYKNKRIIMTFIIEPYLFDFYVSDCRGDCRGNCGNNCRWNTSRSWRTHF